MYSMQEHINNVSRKMGILRKNKKEMLEMKIIENRNEECLEELLGGLNMTEGKKIELEDI